MNDGGRGGSEKWVPPGDGRVPQAYGKPPDQRDDRRWQFSYALTTAGDFPRVLTFIPLEVAGSGKRRCFRVPITSCSVSLIDGDVPGYRFRRPVIASGQQRAVSAADLVDWLGSVPHASVPGPLAFGPQEWARGTGGSAPAVP